MKTVLRLSPPFWLLLFSLPLPLLAEDLLTLKSGYEVEGRIVEEMGDVLIVELPFGTLAVNREEVRSVGKASGSGAVVQPPEDGVDPEALRKSLSELEQRHAEALREIEKLKEERERTAKEIDNIRSFYERSNDAVSNAEREVANLRSKLAGKLEEEQKAVMEKEAEAARFRREVADLQRGKEEHERATRQRVNRLEKDLDEAHRSGEGLKKILAQYEERFEILKANAGRNDREAELKEKIEDLLAIRERLEAELEEEQVLRREIEGRMALARKAKTATPPEKDGAAPTDPRGAEALVFRAGEEFSRGEADRAEDTLREALRLNPRSTDAYTNLGIVLTAKRQLPEAADAYRKAIECGAGGATAHYNLGYVLYRQGLLDEAVQAFQTAAERDPRSPKALHNLALLYMRKRQYNRAAGAFRKLLETDPSFERAYLGMGKLYAEHLGDRETARRYYGEYLARFPRGAQANRVRAIMKEEGSR